jgi:hypothetical protein
MSWLESIQFRTAPSDGKHLADLLLESIGSFRGTEGLLDASVYVNADYEGDLTVVMHWGTDFHDSGGSVIGQRLIRLLGAVSLVNHSVWLPWKETQKSAKKSDAYGEG